MIRVKVPLDLHAVARDGSAAFALATPLLVHQLLGLAVRATIGKRAPQDIFARSMHRTLAGLRAGDYLVEVDGRIFRNPDAVVVCGDTAAVRFFLRQPARAGR